MSTTQLRIDWTRCDGHGLCQTLLPRQIELDEWGFPIIATAPADTSESDLRRAAAACPALALYVERPPVDRPHLERPHVAH